MKHKTLPIGDPVVDPLDTLLNELADLRDRYDGEEVPPLIARRIGEIERIISWARAQFRDHDRADDDDADAA